MSTWEDRLPDCAVARCPQRSKPGSTYCPTHALRDDPRSEYYGGYAPTGSAAIICPHCQVQGRVERTEVKVKRGVSGGKLTGAVLTGGISMLGTGLSRKDKVSEMHCRNCNTVWHV